MEQFIIGLLVGTSLLYILNRFRNYLKAARFKGAGCCGSCGCRAVQSDADEIIAGPGRSTEEDSA